MAKKNSGQIQPGEARTKGLPRNGQGRNVAKPPRILLDMRLVYEDPEEKGATPARKVLQKMFKDDPKGFMNQLTGLEKTYAMVRKAGKEAHARAKRDREAKAIVPAVAPPGAREPEPIEELLRKLGEEV